MCLPSFVIRNNFFRPFLDQMFWDDLSVWLHSLCRSENLFFVWLFTRVTYSGVRNIYKSKMDLTGLCDSLQRTNIAAKESPVDCDNFPFSLFLWTIHIVRGFSNLYTIVKPFDFRQLVLLQYEFFCTSSIERLFFSPTKFL